MDFVNNISQLLGHALKHVLKAEPVLSAIALALTSTGLAILALALACACLLVVRLNTIEELVGGDGISLGGTLCDGGITILAIKGGSQAGGSHESTNCILLEKKTTLKRAIPRIEPGPCNLRQLRQSPGANRASQRCRPSGHRNP